MGRVRYLLSFLLVTAIWLGSAAAAEAQKVSIILGQASAGFEAQVVAQVYNNPTCIGSPAHTENLPLDAQLHSVVVDATRAVRLTAPAAPADGGVLGLIRFNHWSSSAPFTPITGPRDVCVQGPAGTDIVTMTAFYEQVRVTGPQPAACGNVSFAPFPVSPFATGEFLKGLTIADVDGDGNNDLVAGSLSNDRLEIRYGNGHGGFTPPLSLGAPNLYNNGSSFDIRTPRVLDLNGDGRKDIVAVMQNIDQLAVWLAQPGGGFAASSSFMTLGGAVGPQTLALGDMNNDGRPDAVSGNFVNRTAIVVKLGNANGTFGGATGLFLTFADGPYETAVGDFDGDGNNDVVANLTDFAGVAVYRGNGTGGLQAGIRSGITGANGGQGLAVADFNGDGRPDVAAGGSGIFVRFGNGASQFIGGPNLAAPGGTREIVTADFNHDGHADIAASSGQGAIVHLGDGAGGFTQAFHVGVGDVWVNAIGAGDLDRDGRDDFAFGAFHNTAWTSSLYLFQNTCQPNTAPKVTPTTLVRQIGGSTNASPSGVIAQAIDDFTPAGELTVSLGTTTPGLSVTDLVNNNGAIGAKVIAACSAVPGPGMFAIAVTDAHGGTTKSDVLVHVLEDWPPALGDYAATIMNAGASIKIPASFAPADNGSVNSMLARAPGFSGSFSVNLDSGEISVFDGGPPGVYTVQVVAIDNCGLETTTTFQLTVRGTAVIELSDLHAVYNGHAHFATATTTPPGLAGLKITYSQNGAKVDAPTLPGSYDVAATIADPLYDAPAALGVLVIDKGAATMQFGGMTFRYDGEPKPATVTTSPAGLDGVSLAYLDANGAPMGVPVNAGTYQVTAKLANDLYRADSLTGTLTITKAPAAITMPGASFPYDGAAKALTATVTPDVPGLSIAYLAPTGAPASQPINAGTYYATASLDNPNYFAAAVQATLTIERLTPQLTWAPPAPIVAGTALGDAQLNAQASLPGTFSYNPAVGATLAVGVHTLTAFFTPADAINHNGGTISVSLTVNTPPAPSLTLRQTKENLLAQLRSLRATVRDRHTRNGLDDAIDNVEKSLHHWLWGQDGNHLNKWLGSLVFGFEKHAALRLRELIRNKHTTVPDAALQTFITGFAQVDRGLAARAIDDAGNRWIGDAREDLAEGDADLAAGRIAAAFEHYRDAWADATRERRFWNDGDDHGHDYDDCDHGRRRGRNSR